MKRKIKLWLRKRSLMLLSAIVWRLDEWVHAQQLKLRNELSPQKRETDETTETKTGALRRSHDSHGASQLDQQSPGGSRVAARDAQRMAKDRHQQTNAVSEFRSAFGWDSAPETAGVATRLPRQPQVSPGALRAAEKRSVQHRSEPAGETGIRAGSRRQPEPLTPVRRGETFDVWTKRRAGVAPASKVEARAHRERLSARDFDLRFAR